MSDSVEMLYADNVAQVQVTGGVVRLLLGTNKPSIGDDDQPAEVMTNQCLVLPIEGFLRALSIFQQAVDGLEQRGVLKRQNADEAQPSVTVGNGD